MQYIVDIGKVKNYGKVNVDDSYDRNTTLQILQMKNIIWNRAIGVYIIHLFKNNLEHAF